MASCAVGCFSSSDSISGVLRSATVASASATGARVGSRDGMPIVEQRLSRLGLAGDRQRAETGGGAAQQLLKAGVLVGELQRLDEIALVRPAVDAEQADARRRSPAASCRGAVR